MDTPSKQEQQEAPDQDESVSGMPTKGAEEHEPPPGGLSGDPEKNTGKQPGIPRPGKEPPAVD
jgi:hypothetical protein